MRSMRAGTRERMGDVIAASAVEDLEVIVTPP
jgi:hypothetical protein